MDVYQENGYSNRSEYLACLADDYNVDDEVVLMLANTLGEEEDFDALVVALQDEADRQEW